MLLLLLLLGFGIIDPARAAAAEAIASRYQQIYEAGKQRWAQDSNSLEAAWQFARACFDWADLSPDSAQRARIAGEGIAASRSAVALNPKSAPAHYYLGLNLGELAQTKLLGALKLLEEMATAWQHSLALDEQFDHAGAHRSLGLLYRDAPGWPASIGDRGKARQHLRKAVELCPDYPDNQLCLLESYLKWGDKKAVATQIQNVGELLQRARGQLTGAAWTLSWRDWDQRWTKLKAKAAVSSAGSPRMNQDR